jgi:hypothetical protein
MRKIHYLSNLWLVVQAFERGAVRLKLGPPVRITFAAVPGRTFSEKVRLIGKQVNPQSRTIPFRVDVPNEGGLLRPGMSANERVTPGADVSKIAGKNRAQNGSGKLLLARRPRPARRNQNIDREGAASRRESQISSCLECSGYIYI